MKRIFLFYLMLFVFNNFVCSQELYFWSDGKKNSLQEDKSSAIVYSHEQKALFKNCASNVVLRERFDKNHGNVQIIKIDNINISQSDINQMKTNTPISHGLITLHGDTIYLSQRILLYLEENKSLDDLIPIIDKYNLVHISTKYNTNTFFVHDINLVLQVANEIYESGIVKWCHPDFLLQGKKHMLLPRDNQYYIHNKHNCERYNDINILKAWEITKGCPNITVSIIDDGVEAHPDLTDENGISRVLQGYNVVTGALDGSPVRFDDNHGTCIAGIIAASHNDNVRGIAPKVKILPIRIPFNAPYASEYAEAINYAWYDGNADVLSCSWHEYTHTDVLGQAIIDAQTQGRNNLGAVVVFSAGNDGYYTLPPQAEMAISVGALTSISDRASYSNRGADLMAFGGANRIVNGTTVQDIRTIDRVGNNGYSSSNYYDFFGQTSAACPQVSGAAALILSVNPNLSRIEVENILFSTVTDLGDVGKDDIYGHGRLNVSAAIDKTLAISGIYSPVEIGSLSYNKISENARVAFSASPECNIAASTYICDIYKAEKTVNSPFFSYLGYGLSGANPNDGQYYVNISNSGNNWSVFTFFYFVKSDISGRVINQWAPYNPSSVLNYVHGYPANLTINTSVSSMNYFATNSILLTNGFNASLGTNCKIAIVPMGEISCSPNFMEFSNSGVVFENNDYSNNKVLKNCNPKNNFTISEKDNNPIIQKSVSLFPNPSSGDFTVFINDNIFAHATIEIFDLTGKILQKELLADKQHQVHLTNKAKGIYFVKVSNGENTYIEKLLVE